jgi:hypothetical protein
MTNDEQDIFRRKLGPSPSRRRMAMGLIGLGLMMPLAAFAQRRKRMEKEPDKTLRGKKIRAAGKSNEGCMECLKKRARQRSAFVNKEA